MLTVAAGLGTAGCSGGGNDTNGGEDDGDDEGGNSNDTGDSNGSNQQGDNGDSDGSDGGQEGSGDGAKQLTLSLRSGFADSYQSATVTVESLTYRAASEDDESPTLQVGESVDLTEADSRDGVTVSDSLEVPFGSYEGVDMMLTVDEVTDAEGSTVDISGGTLSRSFVDSGMTESEPLDIEDSQFSATLRLTLAVERGQFEITGHRATG